MCLLCWRIKTPPAESAKRSGYRFVIYRAWIWFAGAWFALIGARLTGHRRRIRANLARVWPDRSAAELRRIERDAANNLGRCYGELITMGAFCAHVDGTWLEGPGVAVMQEAQARGQACIFAAAHMGNYLGCIRALTWNGFEAAMLYRRRRRRIADWLFDRTIAALGQPGLKIGLREEKGYVRDMARLVKHVKAGKNIGLVLDQRIPSGAEIPFLGRPAWTSLSMAELAVKYNALLIPAYAERQPDGVSFRFLVEEPIEHGPPKQMMSAYNARVSAWIAANPGQWFWNIRRW